MPHEFFLEFYRALITVAGIKWLRDWRQLKKQVDILLASHNGERYIHKQIDSILTQSYPHFRLIICDDQSSDTTPQIIAEYEKAHPECIRVVSGNRKFGVNQCFSFLLDNAESDYVMFADQDDVWLKHKVDSAMIQMELLEKKMGRVTPILVHSNLKVVNTKLDILSSSFWNYCKIFPKRGSSLNRLLVQNSVTGCTILANRALVERAKPIPEQAIQHDWWFALVAATFGCIKEIDQPSILYRQHSANSIGARKYNAFTYFCRRMSTPLEADKAYRIKNINQANTLLERYQGSLSLEQKEMLTDYSSLLNLKFFQAVPLILKHRFYKHGFSRNLIGLVPKGIFRRLSSKYR